MNNTLSASRQNNPGTIRTEAEVSAKEFRDFKSFLNIIKSDFIDFSLVGGAFRAFSNDHSCIVETGFGFFRDMHFDIPDVKQFGGLISNLDKKTSITVKADATGITIADNLGPIQISRPNPQYINNKFISDKEMIETVLEDVDPNGLIVSEAIPKINVCRIKKMPRALNTECIYLKHEKNNLSKGFLSMAENSRDSEVKMELKKPLLIPMKENHYFNLKILPAIFNKDHMYLKCYLTNDQKIFVMYSTKVNDLFVNIYSSSELTEES